ncbi:hypothetical protein GCM10022286_07400 [Gryllotalpicola daejeonensis]|uniref:YCII-related domain-containing protein n=1 Tax=Gryllotalpicola daejeonensis TaxID=993087 RepID=A0ABP7ZGI7_9MICO
MTDAVKTRYLVVHMTDPTAEQWDDEVDSPALQRWIDAGRTGERWELDGSPVGDRDTARSVVTRNGEVIVTDGPFPEQKEWFMGFDWIEAESIDEAVAIVSTHPSTKIGRLYVVPAAPLPEGVN